MCAAAGPYGGLYSTHMRHEGIDVWKAVDEGAQSMTFAGDVPEGALARLMRATFDRLVDGAAGAAQACRQRL